MSTQVQRRKGTTAQHASFTGASAELTVDTTKNTVVVHDGATAGGIPLAKETGSTISATSLSLPNSTSNGVAYVNGSKVVVAGSVLTFNGSDLSVNGITVGRGAAAVDTNTAIGVLSLGVNVSGGDNTAVGYGAMKGLTTANGNTAVGAVALWSNCGWYNTAIGLGALFPSTGTQNTALGFNAGGSMTSGSKNTIIGSFSGNGGGLDIRTASNYIVLSDGDANPRAWWNGANPTFPGVLTLSDGTANGVPYLNGSKQVTTGSALTFDGTNLGVGGTSGYEAANRTTIAAAGVNSAMLGFKVGSTSSGYVFSDASHVEFGAPTGRYISWDINGEQMRLTSSGLEVKQSQLIGYSSYAGLGSYGLAVAGNVGIGTSSPASKLQVVASSADYFTPQLIIGEASVATGKQLFIGYNTTANTGYIQAVHNGTGYKDLLLQPNGGNLGLGVVPSASNASTSFEMANGSTLFARTVVPQFGLMVNAVGNWYEATYKTAAAANMYLLAGGQHQWYNAPSWNGTGSNLIPFTQAMTLDASSNLLVGQTSAGRQDINGISLEPKVSGGGYAVFNHATGSSSGRQFLTFAYAGTEIGSITQSGTTATLFNVTSDQRLKENIKDAAPASALIDAIQVRQYDWKSDGSHQRYGFIAQELVTVAPEAVHQPTNPEEMMAVDYSKLVPMLVKEIQDLRKRLAAAGIA